MANLQQERMEFKDGTGQLHLTEQSQRSACIQEPNSLGSGIEECVKELQGIAQCYANK